MKKTAKLFLLGSATAFALSLTGPGGDILWGILKPLGALLFGAFFITNLVANEYAKYNEEQKLKQPARSKTSLHNPAPKTAEPRLLAHATAK